MGLKIWMNGQLVDEAQATVSVFDHGLLYGDGVFEGIRVYSNRVFEHEAHIDRLYRSARAIRLDMPVDKRTLMDSVEQTVRANNLRDGYIRLVVTRGVGSLGLSPAGCQPQIIIIADKIELFPPEQYKRGLRVISANTVRNHPLAVGPQIKSLNYLNNILAKLEGLDHGVLEVIMYNHQGFVAEGTGDNVFVVSAGGRIATPPPSAGALEGITRGVVMRLARESGYEVLEQNLTRYDLYAADEMFLTGTGAEVIGVVEIDGRPIGSGRPGPITQELLQKFEAYARR